MAWTDKEQREQKNFAAGVIVWLVNSASLLLASALFDGVGIEPVYIAFVAALAMSAVAFLIEPILHIVALPINVATFGLFTLVLNGIVLCITSRLVAGFHFNGGFWEQLFWAVAAAIIVSFFRMVVRSVLINLKFIQKPEQ